MAAASNQERMNSTMAPVDELPRSTLGNLKLRFGLEDELPNTKRDGKRDGGNKRGGGGGGGGGGNGGGGGEIGRAHV